MKENKILLTFPDDITDVCGNQLGVQVYKMQVKEKLDTQLKTIVVFPAHIEDVGCGFIRGFISEAYKDIDKDEFDQLMEFKTSDKELDSRILGDINIKW